MSVFTIPDEIVEISQLLDKNESKQLNHKLYSQINEWLDEHKDEIEKLGQDDYEKLAITIFPFGNIYYEYVCGKYLKDLSHRIDQLEILRQRFLPNIPLSSIQNFEDFVFQYRQIYPIKYPYPSKLNLVKRRYLYKDFEDKEKLPLKFKGIKDVR